MVASLTGLASSFVLSLASRLLGRQDCEAGTHPRLLSPIHSLLKAPFEFHAHESLTGQLREHLCQRSDFDALLEFAELYDRQAALVRVSLATLRPQLELELAPNVALGSNLSHICRVRFSRSEPMLFGIEGGNYLRHVTVQVQLERIYDLLGLRQAGAGDATGVPFGSQLTLWPIAPCE